MPTPHYPPAAARNALLDLGADIREARLRRRLPMDLLAARGFTSRATLGRIEKGDPRVSIGIYASVLHSLGLLEGLRGTANFAQDKVGQALAAADLPLRARRQRSQRQPNE